MRAVELCSYRCICGGMDYIMKTFRVAGAVLIVLGFIFALLGILTSIFPMIENEHFQVILNSFQETSVDPLTNTLNTIVLFCLRSSYFLLLCGIILMVAGGLISSSARRKLKAAHPASASQRVSPPAAESPGIPKPAYYPGGLEPTADDFNLGHDLAEPSSQAEEALDFGIQAGKPGPISGGVEFSFSSDENDAQKLMRHDQLLASQKQPEAPNAPGYEQYPSNTAQKEPDDPGQSADPVFQESREAPDGPPQKPRIVSTMGKRKG